MRVHLCTIESKVTWPRSGQSSTAGKIRRRSRRGYKQSHSTLVMPDLIRHPEALDSGFRRNDGASDNNETVNNETLNGGAGGSGNSGQFPRGVAKGECCVPRVLHTNLKNLSPAVDGVSRI